ncbi:MAG: UDP-3-O-(3-hydroxymyristoyl)glucosamine N-acyltransferase [Limisphaerales bacterium]
MFSAGQIAEQLGGSVIGDAETQLTGLKPANAASDGDLTFAENEKYFAAAAASDAAAILVSDKLGQTDKPLIKVRHVRVALARLLAAFHPEQEYAPGVHETAVVADSAEVDPSASIGPHCIVEAGAKIGAKTTLIGHNFIGAHARVGESSKLFANVTIYDRSVIGARVRIHAGTVIGSDGYGYVFDEGQHKKIPQVGNVVIEDDVEIGSNVSIDRGAIGPTTIGQGTKIDNLVQIAHNVSTGEHCLLISQVGIAGSTQLGKYVTLAGQAGIAGHLQIGDQVTIAAKSGVMHNIPAGQKWMGAPAQPDRQAKRTLLAAQQLPELIKRVRKIEKELEKLQ